MMDKFSPYFGVKNSKLQLHGEEIRDPAVFHVPLPRSRWQDPPISRGFPV